MRPEIIDYYQGLRSIIDESIDILRTQHPKASLPWFQRLETLQENLYNTDCLRITLIGEFSSGKSSIISALTGEEIFIDADVATSAIHEYPWRDAVLVDTPGVQANDTETNHDQIAREATIGADLVLFVITNELFSPKLVQHLHFVIGDEGLGLLKKTALLINKMDRENNQDDVIVSEVVKALESYNNIPIWLCAAGKYIGARSAREELKKRYIRDSRINSLIENINIFMRETGKTGRLVTPLQEVIDILDQAQSGLIEDNDAQKELELIRRQKIIINNLNKQLMQIRGTWKQKAFSAVMKQAEPQVQKIDATMTDEDFRALFENGLREADGEMGSVYDGLSVEIIAAYNEANSELEELSKSPLSEDVSGIQRKRDERVTLDTGLKAPKEKTLLAKGSKSMIDLIKKPLSDIATNPQQLRNVVYEIGKSLGKKFRPWEAIKSGQKLAKAAGKLGKALPFLSFAVDSYINYREEKVKEEKEKHLANSRIALRNAFATQAANLSKDIEQAIEERYLSSVNEAIQELDKKANVVTSSYGARKELAGTISELKSRCGELRNNLYRGATTESGL